MPPPPWTLADASGISSEAFADFAEQKHLDGLIDEIDKLVPKSGYWPVKTTGTSETTNFSFGDGGMMENYGLIPLWQRKVETVIVFVNTVSPLYTNAGPDERSKGSGIDAYLPPFFGYPVQSPGTFTGHNQVFAASDFAAVTHKLQTAKKAGQPVTTTTEHTVQRNDWWGIEGGLQVQVTWCHLDRGSAWECQLATDIRDAINRGIIIFCCMVRSAIFPTTRPCWKTVLN